MIFFRNVLQLFEYNYIIYNNRQYKMIYIINNINIKSLLAEVHLSF